MRWPNLSNPNKNPPPNGPTAGILGPDLVCRLFLHICSPGVTLGPPGVRDECEGLDEDGEEGEGRRQERVLVEELDPSVGAGVP